MSTTTDMSEFGHVEREEAGKLLTAYQSNNDDTKNFDNSGVHVMFNTMSGYVFLTNADFQVAMLEGDKLVDFYSCPNCGNEGTAEDILQYDDISECCKDYMRDLGEME